MTQEKDSLTQLAISAINKYIDRNLFKDAIDSVVLTIRGFEDDSALFPFLAKKFDNLPYDEFIKIMSHLTQRIQFSEMVIDKFEEHEAKERMTRFIDSMKGYLEKQAKYYQTEGKYKEAIEYLKKALELKPGDEEIKRKKLEIQKSSLEIKGIEKDRLWRWVGNNLSLSVDTGFHLVSKFLDKVIVDRFLPDDLLFSPAMVEDFNDEGSEPVILYESKEIDVKIYKGRDEATLVFEIKN
jgi:tetratricopeptide (TPR) repeat protein